MESWLELVFDLQSIKTVRLEQHNTEKNTKLVNKKHKKYLFVSTDLEFTSFLFFLGCSFQALAMLRKKQLRAYT
jgi:hypothetical protein